MEDFVNNIIKRCIIPLEFMSKGFKKSIPIIKRRKAETGKESRNHYGHKNIEEWIQKQ